MTSPSYINGLGFHVPERIVTNQDMEKIVETSDEWITTRTGIKERRFVSEGQACSDLALEASLKAVADAGRTVKDITHIIVGTFTPDSYCPSAACLVQEKLGLKGIPAFDLYAACSGFLYSLETARGLVALHPGAVVLVVGAEVVSSRVNFEDRTTCVLFGDGAGAAIVSGTDTGGPRIEDVALSADGALGSLLTISGGGSGNPVKLGDVVDASFFVRMQGTEVFRHAVRSMVAISREVLGRNGLSGEDIDLLIPHQANIRIIDSVTKKLQLPKEKVYVNVDKYGNTSAASIPIALAEARAAGQIKAGDTVLLTSFGGGFTWASALLRF
jgi:3-oxoacyl-[acyl-carrier-protein] synthase-3